MKDKARRWMNKWMLGVLTVMLLATIAALPAKAKYYEELTYTVSSEGKVTITDCNNKASGELVIPAEIEGYPVVSIGKNAFYQCSNLTSIDIPEGVTSIAEDAFLGCSALESINIPEGVTRIESYTFKDCSSLNNIIIPKTVTSVGRYAFSYCTSLTNIQFEEGITSIEEFAFTSCSSLTSIALPEGLTSLGDSVFLSCKQLRTVQLPQSLKSIGFAAFNACSGLKGIEIPEGVTKLEGQMFVGCTSLTEVVLPQTLEEIELLAFLDCTSLKSIEIPDSVTTIGDAIFSSCTSLENVKLPKGLTRIGVEMFWGCKSLKMIEFPEGVTEVGNNAFYNCVNLEGVYIHNLKNWCEMFWDDYRGDGTHAMVYADHLYLNGELITGELVIPEGVTKIEKYSFANCDQITSVVLPEELKSIGDYAFIGCTNLESMAIPSGVSYLGTKTFYNCSELVIYLKSAYVRQYVVSNGIRFVAEIKSVSVRNKPYKVEYCLNETFDSAGFLLAVKYTDGYSENITEGMAFSGFDSSEVGAGTIVVNYKDKETSFGIQIYDKHRYDETLDRECNICGYVRNAVELEIETLPKKTEYCLNEEAIEDGLFLKVYYNDGTSGVISSGFETSGFDASKSGTCKITAMYCGTKTTYDITVRENHLYENDSDRECNVCKYERTVSRIQVETLPSKTEYCLSEEADFIGLKLKVYYSDDTVMYVEEGFEASGFSSKEIGVSEITVQYEGVQTTFQVNVHGHSYDNDWDKDCGLCSYMRTVEAIEIKDMPTKIEYCLNEKEDNNGLSISAFYSDGTVGVITNGFETVGFDSSKEGTCSVQIKYEGKETSYEMNVHSHVYTDAVDRVCDKCEYKRTLVSIGVEGIENKKSYCLDELFDYKGFVLQLVYDDASKEVISEGYEVLSFDSSNTKEEKVIISYEGLQTSYDVTIVEHKYGSDTDDTCDVCHKKYTEGNFIYRVEQGKVIIISCATSVQDEVVVSTEMGKREVVKIAPGAFKGCQQMTKITLPDSIISIGATAFKNCYALQNITIPKNVKCIQNGTFYNCSDLREVLLSENLERIEQEAFKNCYGLKKIFIPKSVTNIGDDAFYGTNMVFYINSAYSKYYVLSNNMAYVLVPEKLEVKTLPEKISYSLGESFSSNGLVLNAVFYDDTNEDISEGYIITGFDSSKTGVCTITVEYASKIVTFDVVIHDYKTIWNADGSEHWHECSVCGDKKDIEQHEYDNACDTDCNICGKERSIIHEYGKAWTQGEENHWHECSVCGDKIDIERHTYDNACDTDCNICGKERAIKHDYKVAWTQGEENHWHECSVCGDKVDIERHTYDNACDTDCNICGKERTTKHDYKEEWTQGEESHWHECAVCEDKVDIEKHIYENACDTICNVCHYEREHVKPDKLEVITMPTKSEYILGEEYDLTLQGLVLKATYFDGTTEIITSGYEIDGMDSDEEGIQKIWVVYHGAHAEIRFIVHDYTTEWSVDKTSHWHDCKLCDSKADMGTHHFGNWQVITQATTQAAGLEKHVCTACGHEETRAIAKLPSGTWKHDGIGWWYQNENGTYPANAWKAIDNVWYYFNAAGYMVTGWQSIGGTWYYFAGSGAMATGWQFIDGTWYYLAGSGAMVTGWQAIGGTWYYFAGSGAMVTGWQFVGGVWYYFAGSGAMVTGWQFVDGVWYYFEGSGAMVANRWVGNYYLQADGSMATNKWIGIYYVGADGAWIP